MAPAKGNVEYMVGNNKGKESEDNALSSVTSSLICLTLHTDSQKALDGLEAEFSQITLGEKPVQEVEDLEKQAEQEEEKEKQIEQEEKEKQVKEKEIKDKSDDEEERDSERDEDNEKTSAVQVLEESKESENDKEEKEKKKEEEDEVKADEEKSQDKLDLEGEEEAVASDDEGKGKDKKEYVKEEDESDSNNLSDEDNQNSQPQPKDRKLRSRGYGNAMRQNCVNYMGAEAYQLQQQQQQQQNYPQNQEIWHQPHQYPGLLAPQHVQEGRYPGSSPTGALDEWQGSTQLDALSGKTFIPSLGEYSPVSCTSGEDDMSSASCGYNAESPMGHHDTIPINSPYYQDSQASPYQQDLSHNSQYQDCQPLLYHHQQDNQVSSFHQGLSQNIQYQESQATPCYQGSPQILSPLSYQESPSPMQMFSTSSSAQSQGTHSALLTPPISPQPTTTPVPVCHSEYDIGEIISYVVDEVPFENIHNDSTIESIIRNLLELRDGCSLEEVLDKDVLDRHIKGFAKMKNEDLVKGDKDGDIYYTRILCTGQMAEDYNEKIAACTNRVEKMDLCCNTVVDWSLKQCQICGNSDSETFYSPLSWRNNLGEMPLSNLVVLRFPTLVVEYFTRKVMQRPMDLKRTFVKNYEYFCGQTRVYPCLVQGLRSLQSA